MCDCSVSAIQSPLGSPSVTAVPTGSPVLDSCGFSWKPVFVLTQRVVLFTATVMIGNERVELMLFDTTGQVMIVAPASVRLPALLVPRPSSCRQPLPCRDVRGARFGAVSAWLIVVRRRYYCPFTTPRSRLPATADRLRRTSCPFHFFLDFLHCPASLLVVETRGHTRREMPTASRRASTRRSDWDLHVTSRCVMSPGGMPVRMGRWIAAGIW